MAVIRTRFLFWLIKAYLKKWGKFIAFSFIVGLAFFFFLLKFSSSLLRIIPLERKEIIGMVGDYTINNIPQEIVTKVSRGLTTIEENGTIKPDLASSWQVLNDGKTYVFYLKKNIYFNDGTPLKAKNILYDFTDVQVSHPDDYTIIFTLKDRYAPFLVTVTRPIFYKGYIGTGNYKINNIELNGGYIKSMQLLSINDRFKSQTYVFYTTNEALKTAFALGEVTQAVGLTDASIAGKSFDTFPNVRKDQHTNYQQLVTLFYNTTDQVLSDKKLRDGLAYAIPDTMPYGERIYFPYTQKSKYYNTELTPHTQDYDHAKLLIKSTEQNATNSALPTLHLKTLTKYRPAADILIKSWKQMGVTVTVENVETRPTDFQMYLGDFRLPKDPDQYPLWHSGQRNNITQFKSLRIDKLLEDGRKITDENERIKIYYDFQKYLIDESPAVFLYFPYEYVYTRR
jgi:peptide/nickel transport system substrate-binding protein